MLALVYLVSESLPASRLLRVYPVLYVGVLVLLLFKRSDLMVNYRTQPTTWMHLLAPTSAPLSGCILSLNQDRRLKADFVYSISKKTFGC